MIETLRTGSAPSVSMPTIAWPASWYAVRRLDGDTAVEAPGSEQGLIEDVGTVRRPDDDDARGRVEPVHLGQDLVQRLLALVVPAAEAGDSRRARAADRVELVHEDD